MIRHGFVLVGVLLGHHVGCGLFVAPTTSFRRTRRGLFTTIPDGVDGPGPILDDIPHEFTPLFSSAANTTSPRNAVTTSMGHDPFRFEWGTWVNEDSLSHLMERVDEIRLQTGAYDKLVGDGNAPLRLRVAGGQDWDVILHVLPPDSQWRGRWPTGSWAVVKALTGVAEVAMLREAREPGQYRKAIRKDLRGGSDGSIGGGAATSGAPCVKYVGGPIRSYTGKSGKTVLLEAIVRPPISVVANEESIDALEAIEEALSVYIAEAKSEPKNESGVQKPGQPPAEGNLQTALGMKFDKVGGLDVQLDAIARRVLASRANPVAARRLGVSHVRGILLSGPPGCGKTLLARELARLLGAREPQIVNGPEILDRFIGEAERKVRELFAPAEQEYEQVGDDSGLHVIIFDEMDAIARKRGTASSDTTGVRDSVVNQLLAKMDGVKEATNVLVVGLTNRPELLDNALLRPGRFEVQLRVELPDLLGRRDILRIHTRQMQDAGGISYSAIDLLEDISEVGMAARTEYFTGAELAGLVRSAASFALTRAVHGGNNDDEVGMVNIDDLHLALQEVRPALGKQDEELHLRYPLGISPCSPSMERIMRDLERFITPVPSWAPRLQSLLLVGAGGNGGAGATALAAWAGAGASASDSVNYVRFITALDLLTGDGAGGDESRAGALMERFAEAREMPNSLLVLDDVDQICAGSGPGGYSSIMLATLRALLRAPPDAATAAKAGGHSKSKTGNGKTLHIVGATSRSDAACNILHELFDETIVIPLLSNASEVQKLLSDGLHADYAVNVDRMANSIIERLGSVGCKTALRLAGRAVATAGRRDTSDGDGLGELQLTALNEILDDLAGDEVTAEKMCEVF